MIEFLNKLVIMINMIFLNIHYFLDLWMYMQYKIFNKIRIKIYNNF